MWIWIQTNSDVIRTSSDQNSQKVFFEPKKSIELNFSNLTEFRSQFQRRRIQSRKRRVALSCTDECKTQSCRAVCEYGKIMGNRWLWWRVQFVNGEHQNETFFNSISINDRCVWISSICVCVSGRSVRSKNGYMDICCCNVCAWRWRWCWCYSDFISPIDHHQTVLQAYEFETTWSYI